MASEMLMKQASELGTLFSVGASLEEMFTGPAAGVTLQDISAALYTEFSELATGTAPAVDPVMVDAAVTLTAARAFLVEDYMPARNTPVQPSEREQQRSYLYNKLTQASNTVGVAKLIAQQAALQQWSPSDPRTIQAISLALLNALYTCIFYNELSTLEPIEADAAADRVAMRAAAGALPAFGETISSYVAGVTAGCGYTEAQFPPSLLVDGRFATEWVLVGLEQDRPALRAVWGVYRQILEGGGAALVAEMDAAINRLSGISPWGNQPWAGWCSPAQFRNRVGPTVVAFGDWVANGRTALAALNNIATAQEGWSLCVNCSTLFLVAGGGVCPANRQEAHVQASGPGYLIGSGVAPAGTQDHWFWCEPCAALHYGWGPSVCAMGGAHVAIGSANYWLVSSNTSATNWRYCAKCGVMHDIGGEAANVCAAGGAHETAGSGFYSLRPVLQ
jgi:hypothetical protein